MDAMRILPEFKGVAVHDGWKNLQQLMNVITLFAMLKTT